METFDMRKITRLAVEAFYMGQTFHQGNTWVDWVFNQNTNMNWIVMELHGNEIARKNGNTLILTDAGWQTNTTKERLNGILQEFGLGGIFQRKGQWIYTDSVSGNQTVNEFWTGSKTFEL